MFRVLTHRRRRPLASPRLIAGSVAAHLVVALAAATASGAPTPPAPVPADSIERWIGIDPPPPPDVRPPAVTPPREGSTRELVAPTVVPDRIPDPDPTQPAVDPREFTGVGPIGDTVVARPRLTQPTQPPGSGDVGSGGFTGVYLSEMVEERPALDNPRETGRLLRRYFPPVLADAGVDGRTVVELIVEANGRVRPGSARVVESTHEQFGAAALQVVERLRFTPARVGGQPVAVIVQVPVDWKAER